VVASVEGGHWLATRAGETLSPGGRDAGRAGLRGSGARRSRALGRVEDLGRLVGGGALRRPLPAARAGRARRRGVRLLGRHLLRYDASWIL
jgi:hypothetical protein